MITMPIIKIVTDPNRPNWARVFVDDYELKFVRDINVKLAFKDLSTITVELIGRIETMSLDQFNAQQAEKGNDGLSKP